jgi:cbb3-type cytochrome oxidase subunit 3
MVSEATIPGLEKLHDIVVPAPVSWAPQAPGWYVVFGLVLLGVGWWIYRRLRRFRKNRYRRLALKELTVIERQLQQPERRAKALAEIPALLKWTALAAFPRSEVAALTGEQWLAFLDRNLGGKDFKEGPGRFLSELAYAPAEKTARFSDESIRNLLQLIRRWTKRHEMS